MKVEFLYAAAKVDVELLGTCEILQEIGIQVNRTEDLENGQSKSYEDVTWDKDGSKMKHVNVVLSLFFEV
ncbi:hypothetical protein PsorP6_002427 [Peronosclerospora sorghi]|uniref:Uncharacterized protein n=1 Tax=Peronosclerospora sorghi TaxID=230839 RepID=A0ACC0WTF7_9STRA|nr:hypothetical protein PsorP6_002427 [Peronosclerospora sorghi]